MSYLSSETSLDAGAPIECYLFEGTYQDYLYTSSDITVVLGGKTYAPTTISRTNLGIGTHVDDTQELTVNCPTNLPIVLDYAFEIAPPDLKMTLYRFHRNDGPDSAVIYWSGLVSTIYVNGHTSSIRVPSIFANALKSNLPTVNYQSPCNHVLFDSRCKMDRTTFSYNTTVAGIVTSPGACNIILGTLSSFPNDYFTIGEILSTVSGERRMIVAHTGVVIAINYPFSKGLKIGDAVQVTAGCDHSYQTCIGKFANWLNHGGFPFVPDVNPFTYGV